MRCHMPPSAKNNSYLRKSASGRRKPWAALVQAWAKAKATKSATLKRIVRLGGSHYLKPSAQLVVVYIAAHINFITYSECSRIYELLGAQEQAAFSLRSAFMQVATESVLAEL